MRRPEVDRFSRDGFAVEWEGGWRDGRGKGNRVDQPLHHNPRRLARAGERSYDLMSMALRVVTALMGGALIVLGLAVLPARADAKPYPVRIESQPSGATVYLDSKEGEPLGQTPYTGKLAAGPHTLIIELDGYVSQVQDITIRRKRRVQRIAVRLSKIELATIEVVASRERRPADARGARILVDGKDMGKLPTTVKVPAGPHQVEVVKEGYKTFETWVEAAEGEAVVVAAEMAPLGRSGKIAATKGGIDDADPDDAPDGADEEEDRLVAAEQEALRRDPDASVEREESAPLDVRPVPWFSFGAGFELGGRRFRPNSDTVQGLREYDAGAVPMIRLAGDVNPLAFSPSKWISGWGLYASYARATPLDSAARLQSGMEVDVPTSWSELDVGARFRYRLDTGSHVGVEVGYGTHTFSFEFSADTEELALEVPDVDYAFWRIGLEGRYSFGRLAGLATGGTRLVNAIGSLGDRFAQTDVVALHGGVGLAATITRSIEARLFGRYDRYSHTYTIMPANPLSDATSGVDQFFGLTLSALFRY
jgi:hypothetical protein